MCSAWITEQTEIISPYNNNWLVFIIETECVYCAVRAGSTLILVFFSILGEIYVGQSDTGSGFLPVLQGLLSLSFHQCSILIHSSTTDAVCFFPSTSFFPCQYHSTNASYPFIHLPPTLYNVLLPVLHFPLSVSFHQSSIPIHSCTTDAV